MTISGSRLKRVSNFLTGRLRVVGTLLLISLLLRGVLAQYDTPNWIRALRWSPYEDKVAYATQHGQVAVIEASSGLPILNPVPSISQTFYSLGWSPDGSKLAAGGSGHVVDVWDASDGRLLHTLDLGGEARSIAWSPDGKWLAVAGQEGVPNNVVVWDVLTQQEAFSPMVGEALAIAWSPDSATLAITKLGEIQLWDIVTQAYVRTIPTSEYVLSMDWSPDGTRIAGASIYVPDNPSVKVWDVATGNLLQTLLDQGGSISYVAWDSRSIRLISASTDKSVRIWDSVTGLVLQSVVTSERAYAAAFSPFGGRIAVGDGAWSSIESGIEILVPDPSLERLNSIAQGCISDEGQRSLTLATDTTQLSVFVEQLDMLTDAQIPAGCRADLLAIVGAIQTE